MKGLHMGIGTENKLENVCFCVFRAGKLSQFGAGREQGEILVPRGGIGVGRLPSKPPKAAEKKHHCRRRKIWVIFMNFLVFSL